MEVGDIVSLAKYNAKYKDEADVTPPATDPCIVTDISPQYQGMEIGIRDADRKLYACSEDECELIRKVSTP